MSMDGRYAGFAGAKIDHRLMPLFWRFVFVFLVDSAFDEFGRGHFSTVFAIGRADRVDYWSWAVCIEQSSQSVSQKAENL